MNEQQHVPIEDLAAFAAGDLDAAASVTVEAHVLLCAECRSDVEAVKAATAALSDVPSPVMPAGVAARLDAALAAERAPSSGSAGTVLPMKRRRPSFAGLSAVAAVVALAAAITIPLVTDGDTGKDSASPASMPEAARGPGSGTRRLASGLDYSRDTLAITLDRALAGVTGERAAQDSAGQPLGAAAPQATNTPTTTSQLFTSKKWALSSDPGRLAACITELVSDQPPVARVPLVVDFGTFLGKPATVLVFPSYTSAGEARANRVDVYIVGNGCGAEPGGDVQDFQRILTPRI